MKNNEETIKAAPAATKNETYAMMLENSGERMLELARRLSSKGAPLTKEDRQLIRCAAVPMVRGTLDEMLFSFVSGSNPIERPEFRDIAAMFEDLSER